MGRTTWIVALLVLVACGGKKDEEAPPNGGKPVPPPPGPGAFDKLKVTIDDKQIPMETAIAKTYPDGRIQLYISPKKVVTCQELLVNHFNEKGIDSVLVDLSTRLQPDGTETNALGKIYMGDPVDVKEGTAKVTGTPTKGATINVDLDFTATNGRQQKVVVKGSLPVQGCGEADAASGPGIANVPYASTGVMTIAGKKYPIRGAAIRPPDEIELIDFPRDCNAVMFPGMRIYAHKADWMLSGERIGSDVKQAVGAAAGSGSGSAGSGSGSAAPMTLAIKQGKKTAATGSGSDAHLPTVTLELSGEGMIGKYPVKIEGSVEALDCK